MENQGQSAALCDTITTNSEIQNEQYVLPMFKIEVKEEWIDEENLPCDDYKFQYTPFDSIDHGNYGDSAVYDVVMKDEVPDVQSESSMRSTTIFDVSVKHERLEEQYILDNHEVNSIHYDVLVVPQEVGCKFCDRTFKNRFCLFKHNKEHIKIIINTPRDKEFIPLSHCQYSDRCFKNDGHMQPHLSDVYSESIFECELCGKHFKSELNLRRHNRLSHKLNIPPNLVIGDRVKCEHCNIEFRNRDILHKHVQLCHTGNVDKERNYQCASCKRLYKTKYTLTKHVRRYHHDYGRTFGCSCGEQFRTPMHFYEHTFRQHSSNKCELYKCTHCDAVFNVKTNLTTHMRKVHCDYGKAFQCWCGKQFRSPIHLREHISHQHDGKFKNKNKHRVQCELCQKFLKTKRCLYEHIKNIHQFYGETFKCWCGQHFLSPIKLREHKVRQYERKNALCSGKFQCDYCQKIFKIKYSLREHIKDIHFDYGKVFECWCGKQFRSPKRLRKHKGRHADDNDVNNRKFQCDYCQKIVKNKNNLIRHINNIHYNYGRMFKCWCGKQFRSLNCLCKHKGRHADDNDVNNRKFQCDYCQKIIKNKNNLKRHIKNIHYNYGRMFKCWCSKQFRSPKCLCKHKGRHADDNDVNKSKFQCDYCQIIVKNKYNLIRHIKNIHYNYGIMFKCWCSKQFRSPKLLNQHKRQTHGDNIKNINKTNPKVTLSKIVDSKV